MPTLQHDDNADESDAQGSAYDQIALQHGACMFLPGFGSSLGKGSSCARECFDEDEKAEFVSDFGMSIAELQQESTAIWRDPQQLWNRAQ